MKFQWMLAAAALCVCSLTAHARIEDQLDADARRPHDVQVQIEPQAAFVPAFEDVRVILTFANIGRKAVTLTRWFVPNDEFDEPLFSVTRDGLPVAGTDDWAYGQSAAKSLATSDPDKARSNADSHEYFAENTPALP